MSQTLKKSAKSALENAYVPYSNFGVGAAVKMESGNIYTGCNIENASFSLTCCAERTAIFKAISEGETRFNEMAVICYCRDFGPDSIARKDNQLLFFQTHSWGTIPFARAYLKIPPALTISATLPRDLIGYSLLRVIFFRIWFSWSISNSSPVSTSLLRSSKLSKGIRNPPSTEFR